MELPKGTRQNDKTMIYRKLKIGLYCSIQETKDWAVL